MPKPRRWLLAAAIPVAAITACSGAPGVTEPTGHWDSSRGRDFQDPGPLEVYFDTGFDAFSPRDFAAAHVAQEEAVAACMAELGFEYVPSTIEEGSLVVGEGAQRGTREFAETYGYGVWMGPENEPGQVTAMIDDSANAAYASSLGPEARQAYEAALYGQGTPDGDGMSYDGTGCKGVVAFGPGHSADAFRAGVLEDARAFLESLLVSTDPRLAEVDAAWASCMLDAGYQDASPSAAEARVIDEVNTYWATHSGAFDEELLAEKVDDERRLALADMDCRDETSWAERRRAAEIELQQEYVDAHREDLDAFLEAPATD